MKRLPALLVLCASLSYGQEIQQDIDQLQSVINGGDWAKAAELSRSLKEKVMDARNQALARRGAGLVDSILTWLPQDTETLLVAQEPFTVSGGKTAAAPYLASLLAAAEKGELLKRFGSRTFTLAAVGARKFGEGGPTDNVPRLGMIPYEGCAVFQLPEMPGDVLLNRVPEEKLEGHSVWLSRGSEGDGPDWETIYVTMLDPQLLTACNSHEFLREMLSRKSMPRQPRALPEDLPEWSLVDRNSPVWGISHYRNGGPLREMMQAPDASGIAVNFGNTAVTARMISKTDPWGRFANLPEFQGGARTRLVDSGVWEFSVSAQGQTGSMGVFALMGAMGFVVVI
jgi:hypothetical protein